MKFSAKKIPSEDFIKFETGKPVKGLLRGEFYEFYQHWVNQKPIKCPGANCEYCKAGDKAKFTFRVNMLVKNERNEYEPKILAQGKMLYNSLRNVNSILLGEGEQLEEFNISILKEGSGMNDTKYSAQALPNGQLSEAAKIAVKSVALKNLREEDEDEPEAKDELQF